MNIMRGVALCALLTGLFATSLFSAPAVADHERDPWGTILGCAGVNEAVTMSPLDNPVWQLGSAHEGVFADDNTNSYGLFVYGNSPYAFRYQLPDDSGPFDSDTGTVTYHMTGTTDAVHC